MIQLTQPSWWYWAITTILLYAGLAGLPHAFTLAIVLSVIQIIHFRLREGSFLAFPTQVRIAYTAILLIAMWRPLHALYWVPAIGTLAQILFGYCFLARSLSLLKLNRREPLSWRVVWRTYTNPPVSGSILQGLPANH